MSNLPHPRVEFYLRGGGMIDACRSTTAPREGEYVNINRQQYRVAYTSWSLDGTPRGKELRANVELEKVPDDQVGPYDEKEGN